MMDEIVEIDNIGNVCRLCLTLDAPKCSIFGDQDSAAIPLVAKIQDCLSIQVTSSDKLSTLICEQCVESVKQWHAYKESCLQSQNKLNQWLSKQTQSTPMVITIKEEPVEFDLYEDNVQIVAENEISESGSVRNTCSQKEVEKDTEANDVHVLNVDKDKSPRRESLTMTKEADKSPKTDCPITVKSEPQEDEDTDCTIEIESVTGNELLLNPLAIISGNEDRVIETEASMKSGKATSSVKRKLRRGPHTHYRGTRIYKQKCKICRFNLHSKYSYMKHMQRFHSDETNDLEGSESCSQGEEETIEDLEDELISMEKDSPLTQVQQNIISQLKTFSCYSCNQSFGDRRSTLNHIRQHMPDLRPYTCIACLTEFADRSIYKLHCGASFECAMKIALVIPKHGVEKYFTCNMCLRPMPSRKELLSHLSKHSDKQYEEMTSPSRSPPKLKPMASLSAIEKPPEISKIAGPYKGGDPAHNHTCDLCGMIYRYRPNMFKHRELCARLEPETRTSYKCVHCGMTFLVFKRFHSHMTTEHKKKEFTCPDCNVKFRSPSDYLTHHEEHRVEKSNKNGKNGPINRVSSASSSENLHKGFHFSCALCGQEFLTRTELTEHRNLHLKVKIYSCVICRSMFSSPGALEIHMKDHGIEDPNERTANSSCVEYGQTDDDFKEAKYSPLNATSNTDSNTSGQCSSKCSTCGKVFSNSSNLKRHIANAHEVHNVTLCSKRTKTQKSEEQSTDKRKTKGPYECPDCPKVFVFQGNLKIHRESAHGVMKRSYECDICSKEFAEESSLKIHRSWHNRANSRYNVLESTNEDKFTPEQVRKLVTSTPIDNSDRPATARKSFPNRSSSSQKSPRQIQSDLHCQVCDDRFTSVADLRKHLWDVHCARNKPEKNFSTDELQCELCTNVFPDQESLKQHMEWHKAHPILGEAESKHFPCDICGKRYSSKNVLYKHKKLHKSNTVAAIKFQSLAKKSTANQYFCTVCRRIFSSPQSLQRHRVNIHKDLNGPNQPSTSNGTSISLADGPTQKRIKVEMDDNSSSSVASITSAGKKSVTCHLCRKIFPNMSLLYKHKQSVHKTRGDKFNPKPTSDELVPLTGVDGKFGCNVCGKQYNVLNHLRQHFRLKHKHATKYTCSVPGCTKGFPTQMTLQNHEMAHRRMQFPCSVEGCDRVFSMLSCQKNHEATHRNESRSKCTYRGCNTSPVRPTATKSTESQQKASKTEKCTLPRCSASFTSIAALEVHEATHNITDRWKCRSFDCAAMFSSPLALKIHKQSHNNMIYSCNLCDKHFFSSENMANHMTVTHNTTYEATGQKTFHRETDLSTYVVPGAVDATCPGCKVRYPNKKAMKIHFFKFHEIGD